MLLVARCSQIVCVTGSASKFGKQRARNGRLAQAAVGLHRERDEGVPIRL
jgi:hypothetical protein